MVRLQKLTTTPDPFFPLLCLCQLFLPDDSSVRLQAVFVFSLLFLSISEDSSYFLHFSLKHNEAGCDQSLDQPGVPVSQWEHFLSLLCCRKERRTNRAWSHPNNIRFMTKKKKLPRTQQDVIHYFVWLTHKTQRVPLILFILIENNQGVTLALLNMDSRIPHGRLLCEASS